MIATYRALEQMTRTSVIDEQTFRAMEDGSLDVLAGLFLEKHAYLYLEGTLNFFEELTVPEEPDELTDDTDFDYPIPF